MATIITRAGKGSPLTNTEVDDNFTNLNTDKAELSGAAFTGNVSVDRGSSSVYLTLTGANPEIILNDSTNTNTCSIQNVDGTLNYKADEDNEQGNSRHRFYTDGTQRMEIDSSGNVGIGTTSPAANLHVDASAPEFRLSQSGTVKVRLRTTGDNYINTGQNLGIGTTSPDYKADINVNSTSPDDTQVALRIKSTTTANMTNGFGVNQLFSIEDSLGANFNIAQLLVVRDGADDSGAFLFAPYSTGTAIERMRIDSSGKVGIGTSSPAETLDVKSGNASTYLRLQTSTDGGVYVGNLSGQMLMLTDATERMRIDSSGNLLVGTTTQFGTDGISLNQSGWFYVRRTSDKAATFRLDGNDGNIITFDKAGSTVGSIGSNSSNAYISGTTRGLHFTGTAGIIPCNESGVARDADTDLGKSDTRFKDIYRSGSTYSTSDRNKKQDIRDLTDAEARVATVAKGSLKAFRYIDSVEAEGDEANIHFGIIAQDLKAAFEAEGLNANDYQVFKTSTYTDDDGVEQTTYSICYENLLAFIIAAI